RCAPILFVGSGARSHDHTGARTGSRDLGAGPHRMSGPASNRGNHSVTAERQARSREMWRARYISHYPEGLVNDVARKLDKLDGVDVVAADKAFALINIAKRRKALAPKLAERRREQRALRRFMTR